MDFVMNCGIFLSLIMAFLYIAIAAKKHKEGKKSAWIALGLAVVAILIAVWLILFY